MFRQASFRQASVRQTSARAARRLRLSAAALAVGVIAPLGVTALAAPAAATDSEVLVLGSTLDNGTNSIEISEITAQGFTPVIVDDATWAGMTTAQFASYRAIVLGDPNGDLSNAQAAVANTATWGAAVTGSVVLVGTDPSEHVSAGANGRGGEALTRGSIDVAVSQPGKTGLYIALSEYYEGTPPNTPATLLDGLRGPGVFTMETANCNDDVHIAATHPALTNLTNGDLSNWSCSSHEIFDSFPADFQVLAIAANPNGNFTAADGTQGDPYILAAGGGVKSFPLSLSPTSQQLDLGQSATVTAELLDVQTRDPVSGQAIAFVVDSGPNAGASGTCTPANCVTRADGTVDYSYVGSGGAGVDSVRAFIDKNGSGQPDQGEPQTTAAVTWVSGGGPVGGGADLSASVATNHASQRGNGPVTYTVTVHNAGPAAAANVTLGELLPAVQTDPTTGTTTGAIFLSGATTAGHCAFPAANTRLTGQSATCSLGTLASGDTVTVTLNLALASRSRASSNHRYLFTNTATVSSSTNDPDTSNNSASTTVTYRVG